MHELRLGRSADRGVARLPRDAIEGEGEEQRAGAAAGGGERGFASGVPGAHHDDVKVHLLLVQVVGGNAGVR